MFGNRFTPRLKIRFQRKNVIKRVGGSTVGDKHQQLLREINRFTKRLDELLKEIKRIQSLPATEQGQTPQLILSSMQDERVEVAANLSLLELELARVNIALQKEQETFEKLAPSYAFSPETKFCLRDGRSLQRLPGKAGNTGSGQSAFWARSFCSPHPERKLIVKPYEWVEAYASAVNSFCLGEHAQSTCFIRTGLHDVGGLIKPDPTFQSLLNYFLQYKKIPPVGRGLGGIIVMIVLLAEPDSGAMNESGNVGLVFSKRLNDWIYYRIDNAMSFEFNGVSSGNKELFDLKQLKNPTIDMPVLKHNGLDEVFTPERFYQVITPEHLKEISDEAKRIAKIDRQKLIMLLDMCEAQLAHLEKYPYKESKLGNNNNGAVLTKPHKTYKSAILERFDLLAYLFPSK